MSRKLAIKNFKLITATKYHFTETCTNTRCAKNWNNGHCKSKRWHCTLACISAKCYL